MISIEPTVAETIDAYRTCEFVTLRRDGTPLVWPIATRRREDGTFLVTTSLAFAQKALNVRRDGRVALLFSDFTGSGLKAPKQVFVSGTAACPEAIVTSPAGNEAYWSMLFDRQPDSRRYVDPPARWLMDWYYLRLLITVTPTKMYTRASLAELSGDAEGTVHTQMPLLGANVVASFPTAVLAACDSEGSPLLMRTRTAATSEGFVVEPAADSDIVRGPASLLVHRHDERLANFYNALVLGELRQANDGRWLLVPDRVIKPSGDGGTRDLMRLLRTARRTTRVYLRRRGLERPPVDWPALKALAVASAARDAVS